MLQFEQSTSEMKQLYPPVQDTVSRVDVNVQSEAIQIINRSTSTSLHKCSVVEETYTQTSKTVIELAESEGLFLTGDTANLQTQTSFISITENKTVQYRIEVTDNINNGVKVIELDNNNETFEKNQCNPRNERLNFLVLDQNDNNSESCSETDYSAHYSDIEEDSLKNNKDKRITENKIAIPELITPHDDVEDLYKKVVDKLHVQNFCQYDFDRRNLATLTPVTEESTVKSIIDITPNEATITADNDPNQYIFHEDNTKKMLPKRPTEATLKKTEENFRLPPIKNLSRPNTENFNLLFNTQTRPLSKFGKPCFFESPIEHIFDQLKSDTNNLASGENMGIGEWKSR